MTEALVVAMSLGKSYQQAGGQATPVLFNVDCQIEGGARIALVGPSGSGKSTLLHLLCGLIVPSSGQVIWPGLGVAEDLMPGKVQAVFQSPSLFPALNVHDNIALPMLLLGRAPGFGLAPDDLLARFGLADLGLKLPEELSGGQAQRVAMLRALSVAPRLILADEPTGQLDGRTAAEFLSAVIGEAEGIGAALVIATHDPAVAARMDQRWFLDHGRLVAGAANGAAG